MRLLISFELTSIHHNQFIQVHFPPLRFLWDLLAEYWRRVVKKFWLLLLPHRQFLKLFFSRCNHIVISRCKSTFFSLILLGNTLPPCHGELWSIDHKVISINRACKSWVMQITQKVRWGWGWVKSREEKKFMAFSSLAQVSP